MVAAMARRGAKRQFTIRDLFLVTVLCALVVGVAQLGPIGILFAVAVVPLWALGTGLLRSAALEEDRDDRTFLRAFFVFLLVVAAVTVRVVRFAMLEAD